MNHRRIVFIILAVTAIVYTIVIYYIPDFITDDLLIFTEIKSNPSIPIILNSKSEFFLFLRPVSYLSFWIDYHLFNTNAVFMKIHSLIYLLSSVILMYLILQMLSKKFNWDIPRYLIYLSLIFFAVHFDNMTTVFWIADRTEVLSFFFYLLAISYFLRSSKNTYSFAIAVTTIFVLASLSKQSVLHLPFVLLVLYISLQKIKNIKTAKYIMSSFYLLFGALMVLLLFNLLFAHSDLSIVISNLWKKPFAAFGILLYALNPFLGDSIYNFFLTHKLVAIIFAVIVFLGFVYKLNSSIQLQGFFKKMFPFLIILAISFIPRLFVVGGRRLNTIQLFWIIVVGLAAWRYSTRKYVQKGITVFLSFVILLNILTSYLDLQHEIELQHLRKNRIISLNNLTKEFNLEVIAAPDIILIPFQLYYYRMNSFGKANIKHTSIHYRSISYMEDSKIKKKISCDQNGKIITIISLSNMFYLDYLYESEREIILKNPTPSGRHGYKEIKYKLNKEDKLNKWIYFDGSKWEFIK